MRLIASPPATASGGRRAGRRPAGGGAAPVPWGRLRGAVLLALAIGAIALGLHSRPFLLTSLRITGLRQVSPAEVQVDIHLHPGTYTWQVRPWVVVRRLLRDPMIASARASLQWPGGLAIAIRERVPVALVAVPGGRWEVSARGRLLRYLPASGGLPPWEAASASGKGVPGLPPGLPLITGVSLTDPVAGQTAHGVGLHRTLGVARGLGAAAQSLAARIAWSQGVVQVITRAGLAVDYGNGSQARRKTEILLGILRVVAREKVRLVSVDLRAPTTPAVRLKPGSPPLVVNGRAGG